MTRLLQDLFPFPLSSQMLSHHFQLTSFLEMGVGVDTGLTFKENLLKVIWLVESYSQCTLLVTEINREGA